MRLSFLTVLGLMFVAIPAMAQAAERIVTASYTCSQKVPCDSSGSFTSAQWAQAGNACLANGFAYTSQDGFIDDTAGLDSSNCLTPKMDAVAKVMGANFSPECCIVNLADNTCVISCNIVRK